MEFRLTEYEGSGFVTFKLSLDRNKPHALNLIWEMNPEGPLLWPEYRGKERQDHLWQSTCLELFIGSADCSNYLELNFSPSGAWNAYDFEDYRSGMKMSDKVALLELHSVEYRLEASISLLENLPSPLLIGPAAVLQTQSGQLQYFAVEHEDPPDFHKAALHQRVDHL